MDRQMWRGDASRHNSPSKMIGRALLPTIWAITGACSRPPMVDPNAQYDTHAGPLEFWCKKTTKSSFAYHIGDVSAIRKDGDSYWLTFIGQMDEAGRPDAQQLRWIPKILGLL